MDDKIATLLAKQEIYELACRYSRGLDRLDRELLLSVFHADGWCEYGFSNGVPADQPPAAGGSSPRPVPG